MSKIFILPKTKNSLKCIVFKHPKDHSNSTFFYEQTHGLIYELCVQKNKYFSWFFNNETIKDGNLYLMTPIDPLFLLIPLIYKKTEKFQNIYDIFTENGIPASHIEFLQSLYSPNVLKCINEVKIFEDDVFIKFSHEKTLKWLSLKFQNIKQSLLKNKISKNLFGFKLNNYSSGESKLSEDEYKILAFEMISDYICQGLEIPLKKKLCIPDKDLMFAQTIPISNKRKLEKDSETTLMEEVTLSSQILKEKNTKKPKMTRTQLTLNKVDKSGMKNITSYFLKKSS